MQRYEIEPFRKRAKWKGCKKILQIQHDTGIAIFPSREALIKIIRRREEYTGMYPIDLDDKTDKELYEYYDFLKS